MARTSANAAALHSRDETNAADGRNSGAETSVLEGLPVEQVQEMYAAGVEIEECYRVLRKVNANVVGEVLKGEGTFYEWDHFPKGDVFDHETHSQYYYHAHRSEAGEHGHFHAFLRAGAFPAGVRAVSHQGAEPWPTGEDALSHLIAIAMDKHGYPTHLFTTNRWVTGETFFPADGVAAMVERFAIDHAFPSWPTNRWLTAMLKLFRPQIAHLLGERDRAIEHWRAAHPEADVYEDRALEITSAMSISVARQVRKVRKLLKRTK